MIDFQETGLFFPQNAEYVVTSNLVKEIAKVYDKKVWFTKLLNPFIRLLFGLNVVNKLFGTLAYDMEMSKYLKGNYRIRTFEESIELTEK